MSTYLLVDWVLKHFIFLPSESLSQPHEVGSLLSFARRDSQGSERLRISLSVTQTGSQDRSKAICDSDEKTLHNYNLKMIDNRQDMKNRVVYTIPTKSSQKMVTFRRQCPRGGNMEFSFGALASIFQADVWTHIVYVYWGLMVTSCHCLL